jgi:nucleotide-binding universal stress UspA family protein
MAGEQCVIVGVDSSPESRAALGWTLRLADALGWRVVAVHAVGLLEAGGYQPPIDVIGLVEEAGRRTDVEVDASVEEIVEAGHPAETLVRVAEREEAALIVVGSRGLGRSTGLLGSTSEGVLARAVTPVLVVPASSTVPTTDL